MAKKPFGESLRRRSSGTTPPQSELDQAIDAAKAANAQPGRVGKKAVVKHLVPDDHSRLRILAINQNKTLSAVIGEALDDYLQKHGEPPLQGA